MTTKRVLVTGGTGFLGGEIIKALIEQRPEFDLAVLDIKPLKPEVLQNADIRYFHADVTDPAQVFKAVEAANPDVIVHTAGFVPTRNARYNQKERSLTFRVNVEGTRNTLDAAAKFGIKYFVYTSSCTLITDHAGHDYPNMKESIPYPPGSETFVYGESKAIAERLVLDANSPSLLTCAIRPSTLFGVGDYQLVPTIHSCISKGETPYIVGTGINLYDFSYAPNIADAHVLAVNNLLTTATAAGEAFFISNGEPVPFRAFCIAVWANFGHIPTWEVRVPRNAAWAMGWLAEWATWFAGREATLSRGSVKDATQTAYASLEKARKVLGYKPRVGLVEGLKIACEVSINMLDPDYYPDDTIHALRGFYHVKGAGIYSGAQLPTLTRPSIAELI